MNRSSIRTKLIKLSEYSDNYRLRNYQAGIIEENSIPTVAMHTLEYIKNRDSNHLLRPVVDRSKKITFEEGEQEKKTEESKTATDS